MRNHIPISGPATREPCEGNEPDLRLSLGFTPRWYNARLNINFGEEWHKDPVYRYETLLIMKKELHKLFPMHRDFELKYSGNIEETSATISGAYGITLIPQMYGVAPLYFHDNWPNTGSENYMTQDQIGNLKPFVLSEIPVFQELMQQMDIIEKKYGKIHGYLNYQGILNAAIKIRGRDIFLDIIDKPDLVIHFFNHIADTILRTSKTVQARQRKSGFNIDLLSMSNCVINMISPQQYKDFVFPIDKKLSKEYKGFGIHTCNWDVTPYLEVLRGIDKMGYLDTGMQADFKKFRQIFPDTRRAVLYDPVDIESKTFSEIKEDVRKIYDELAPCDIVLADVEYTTPISRIIEFIKLVDEIAVKKNSTYINPNFKFMEYKT